MPEIRASTIAPYAEDESGNPLLVARDEYGVLRPVTRVYRLRPSRGEFEGGPLKGHGEVLALEVEHE